MWLHAGGNGPVGGMIQPQVMQEHRFGNHSWGYFLEVGKGC